VKERSIAAANALREQRWQAFRSPSPQPVRQVA